MKSKINVGVIFGGRSVENEISVLTAIQAINAIDTEKYSVTPIYISKQGRWYTGKALTDSSNYRYMDSLLASCDEVYLRPTYGDNNLPWRDGHPDYRTVYSRAHGHALLQADVQHW